MSRSSARPSVRRFTCSHWLAPAASRGVCSPRRCSWLIIRAGDKQVLRRCGPGVAEPADGTAAHHCVVERKQRARSREEHPATCQLEDEAAQHGCHDVQQRSLAAHEQLSSGRPQEPSVRAMPPLRCGPSGDVCASDFSLACVPAAAPHPHSFASRRRRRGRGRTSGSPSRRSQRSPAPDGDNDQLEAGSSAGAAESEADMLRRQYMDGSSSPLGGSQYTPRSGVTDGGLAQTRLPLCACKRGVQSCKTERLTSPLNGRVKLCRDRHYGVRHESRFAQRVHRTRGCASGEWVWGSLRVSGYVPLRREQVWATPLSHVLVVTFCRATRDSKLCRPTKASLASGARARRCSSQRRRSPCPARRLKTPTFCRGRRTLTCVAQAQCVTCATAEFCSGQCVTRELFAGVSCARSQVVPTRYMVKHKSLVAVSKRGQPGSRRRRRRQTSGEGGDDDSG